MKNKIFKILKVSLKVLFVILAIIIGGVIMLNITGAVVSNDAKRSVVNRLVDSNRNIKTMSLLIQSKNGDTLVDTTKGGITQDDEFAVASVSKLYTHAIVFRLIDEGVLSYDDKLSELVPEEEIEGLHSLNEKQHASDITIKQLLDQTTGFPDYETDKQPDGKVILEEVLNEDQRIDYSESLAITKSLTPEFAPGAENKAYYSNMNSVLLGRIAELKTSQSLDDLFKKYIFGPLDLKNTYASQENSDFRAIYLGDEAIQRPKYISSSLASGGVISTNNELMVFIRAFFEGKLFKKDHINNPTFNRIQFFPIEYGSGMMKVEMNRLMSPLFPAPRIIGHSGSSGSFAYYCPSKEVYITGTINQIKSQPYPTIYMYLNTVD